VTGTQSRGLDAPPTRQAVLGCWLRNDLTRAAALARHWTSEEPDSLDAWIMLAETCTRQHYPQESLQALQKAAQIDGNHPLFWRALCQAALQAGAFYAAHGAVAAARYTAIRPAMLAELEKWLKDEGLVDTRGNFLKPEASEDGWQDLVPRIWQPNREDVPLCWGRLRGRILVYPLDFAAPAAAFASGQGPEIWFNYPAAVEKLSRTYETTFLQVIPPPELFNPFQAYFLQASLHLCGFFPVKASEQKWISQTPVGALEIHVFGSRHFCIIENEALLVFLCKYLPHVFNGRITLSGPNSNLEAALPWLAKI
jgi:hypothetical protein